MTILMSILWVGAEWLSMCVPCLCTVTKLSFLHSSSVRDAKTMVSSMQHATVMSMQWLKYAMLSMQDIVKGCKTGFP